MKMRGILFSLFLTGLWAICSPAFAVDLSNVYYVNEFGKEDYVTVPKNQVKEVVKIVKLVPGCTLINVQPIR